MAALIVLFCKVMKSAKFEGQSYFSINFMLIIAAVYTCLPTYRNNLSFLLVKRSWFEGTLGSVGNTCGLVAVYIYTAHTRVIETGPLCDFYVLFFPSTSISKLVFWHCVTYNYVTTWLQLSCELFQLVWTQQHAVVVISVSYDLTVEVTVHQWLEPAEWISQRFLCE